MKENTEHMDHYLNPNNATNRLIKEYCKYDRLTVAYDFDNTVYDYHKEGHQYTDMIDLLVKLKEMGCYLIIFTANEDEDFVKQYCNENEIPFDVINENPPFYKSESRKIYYNVLLDDRAGLREAYDSLNVIVALGRLDKLFKEES